MCVLKLKKHETSINIYRKLTGDNLAEEFGLA